MADIATSADAGPSKSGDKDAKKKHADRLEKLRELHNKRVSILNCKQN
jgi:hypothetical protein